MDLQAEIADWPVGSASVAVIGPQGVIDLVDDGRSHPWASVTKILTALTILDASLEGVVDLDDEVGPPGSTLRHLLSHASGLSPDSDRIMAAPGTRRIYSNHGIDVAAHHLEQAGDQRFHDHLEERVLGLLDMSDTALVGPPAHGARGSIEDLATLGWELLRPRLLMPEVVRLVSTPAYPGLSGVLPGFGKQQHNDWGLGCEIRADKSPHWTAPGNSPATFGHFGQSGSFVWVDRSVDLACVSLCDTAFGPWAAQVWPRLSARVLEAYA